ncbi:MAG: hypothetical protein JNJ69_00410 [Leptospiraceae bacterium]|nr:hypothetical protein [Leptospiraceae bacterium]
MGEKISCSACCGIFNLKFNAAERTAWAQRNTEIFLALDLTKAENIVAYRKEREAETLPQRIRDDIYVCPFVGFVGTKNGSHIEQPPVACEPGASVRTGCLLHPQGSPHPQISLWEHPQNFSFYGEGICLSYDCLAKERQAFRADFFRWAEGADGHGGPGAAARTTRSLPQPLYAYGRLASDHTLHRTLAMLAMDSQDLSGFYTLLAELYETYSVVTTSFEDVEKVLPQSIEELCLFLARRIDAANAEQISALLSAAWHRHTADNKAS